MCDNKPNVDRGGHTPDIQGFIKAQPGHAKKVTINNKPIHETMMKKQTLTIPDKAIIIPLTHILLKQLMVPCSVAYI